MGRAPKCSEIPLNHFKSPLNPFQIEASTTAYLTACYALGVRDGHDDNIMLREDSLFILCDPIFIIYVILSIYIL